MKAFRLSLCILTLFCCAAAASAQFFRFGPAGGQSGSDWIDTRDPADVRITEVRVWTGKTIDGIQVVVQNGDGVRELAVHGNTTSNEAVFKVEEGEYLTSLSGKVGGLVDSIQVATNTGRTSPRMGGSGGTMNFYYEAPPGFQIIGVFGRGDRSIASLGVIVTAAPGQ